MTVSSVKSVASRLAVNYDDQLLTNRQRHNPGLIFPWQWSLTTDPFLTEQGHCSMCQKKWGLRDKE